MSNFWENFPKFVKLKLEFSWWKLRGGTEKNRVRFAFVALRGALQDGKSTAENQSSSEREREQDEAWPDRKQRSERSERKGLLARGPLQSAWVVEKRERERERAEFRRGPP